VYASRDAGRPHLEPFFSPSFSAETWRDAAPAADKLMARIADETTSGPWQLVTVGRLTDNKNQQTIVRAVADMVALGLDVQLAVYGDGPNRDALEELARSLGVADRVSFRGSVSHGAVMEAFASSDISLLSTRQEGYGKVLLECMVYGVVPVFGRSPVAAEISGEGSRGFVIDPDDHEAMAARVADLVGDRARWLAMARDARDHTETMTLDAFQDRVRELLERQWKVELVPPTGVR
jgi:glycosyltransferase involved in cell wall biosynthesis